MISHYQKHELICPIYYFFAYAALYNAMVFAICMVCLERVLLQCGVSPFLCCFSCTSSAGFGDLTEDATHGLHSVLNRRCHSIKDEITQAVNAYSTITAMDSDLLHLQDTEESEDGFTSPESDEENVTA